MRVAQNISNEYLIEKYGFKVIGNKNTFPYGSLEVKDKEGLGVSIWWADRHIQILLGEHAEYGIAEVPPVLYNMIVDGVVEFEK